MYTITYISDTIIDICNSVTDICKKLRWWHPWLFAVIFNKY